jgi:hypothetical protein
MKRPPVVHPQHHFFVVGRVAHAHVAGQGQCWVGCCHGVHVVNLAQGRAAAMKLAAIPRGQTTLDMGHVAAQSHITAARHLIRFIGAARPDGFDLGFGVGHRGQVGWWVAARAVTLRRGCRARAWCGCAHAGPGVARSPRGCAGAGGNEQGQCDSEAARGPHRRGGKAEHGAHHTHKRARCHLNGYV